MSKELPTTVRQPIKGVLNETARNVTFAIGAASFARGLSPAVTPLYQEMIRKLRTGERVVISELTGLLHGYDVYPSGLEHLEELSGRPFIVVTNHFHGGPLRGFWQVVATSHLVRTATGQELRWVQGSGSRIVKDIHDMVASATNNIVVGGVAGVREIERTLLHRNTPVAIHPEGAPSRTLTKGDYRAGRILLHAAERNIPIIYAAAWLDTTDLFVKISSPMNNETLKNVATGIQDTRAQGQAVVDAVMGNLAIHLPPPLRGYYARAEIH